MNTLDTASTPNLEAAPSTPASPEESRPRPGIWEKLAEGILRLLIVGLGIVVGYTLSTIIAFLLGWGTC